MCGECLLVRKLSGNRDEVLLVVCRAWTSAHAGGESFEVRSDDLFAKRVLRGALTDIPEDLSSVPLAGSPAQPHSTYKRML